MNKSDFPTSFRTLFIAFSDCVRAINALHSCEECKANFGSLLSEIANNGFQSSKYASIFSVLLKKYECFSG